MEATIKMIADFVVRNHLEDPVRLIFESLKPLALMGGPLSRVFIAPYFTYLGVDTRHVINTLEQPENIDKLLKRIEEKVKERKKQKNKKE